MISAFGGYYLERSRDFIKERLVEINITKAYS